MSARRIVKISILSIVSLVSLLLIGVCAFMVLVSPNTFKPIITKGMYDSTGRTLTINGDISWKLWPNIGLKIDKVSLSNPKGFTPDNMLDVAQATVAVQLMPLLDHNLIIDNIAIDGLNVGLIKKDDLNNWTFTPPATPVTNNAPSQSARQMQLELSKFTLINTTFSYTDEGKHKQYSIKNFAFNLQTQHNGKISVDQNAQKIELSKVKFDFDGIINGQLNFMVDNFSDLKYQGDFDINSFSLPKLADKLNEPIGALKGTALFDQVALGSAFKGDVNSITLEKMKFNLSDIVKGLLNVRVGSFSNMAYSGDVDLPAFSANKALDKMNIGVNDRKGNQLLDTVGLKTNFSGNANNINLQQLKFNFPGLLKGVLNANVQNFAKPVYSGNLNLPTFSLNQLMAKSAMSPIDIPNKQLLDKVSLQTNFSGAANSVKLTQLLSKISDSVVSGSITLPSIKPLNVVENIHIDKLELSDLTDTNGYRLPLTGIVASGGLSNSRSGFKDMSGVNATQNVTIANITVLGFDLNNLIAEFDNALSSTGRAVTLENLQPLTNSAQVVKSVNNMQNALTQAKSHGQKDYTKKTDLGAFQTNLVMRNGVANPSSFKLGGLSIKSNGSGQVNMVDKSLDYTIVSQIVAAQKNEILNKLSFPYSAHGKFDNIQGDLDWASIQKQLLEYVIEQTGKQTKSAVNTQLNNILKTGASSPAQQQQVDTIKKDATNLINNIFK